MATRNGADPQSDRLLHLIEPLTASRTRKDLNLKRPQLQYGEYALQHATKQAKDCSAMRIGIHVKKKELKFSNHDPGSSNPGMGQGAGDAGSPRPRKVSW